MKEHQLAFKCLLVLHTLGRVDGTQYEVWGSDQSNSAKGQELLGVKGSYLWIWKSSDIEKQIISGKDAVPLPCLPGEEKGPCNMLDVFPQNLEAYKKGNVATKSTLADLDGFGRLHGALIDPQNLYANTNFFGKNMFFLNYNVTNQSYCDLI